MKTKEHEIKYGEKLIKCVMTDERMKSVTFRLSKDGTFIAHLVR